MTDTGHFSSPHEPDIRTITESQVSQLADYIHQLEETAASARKHYRNCRIRRWTGNFWFAYLTATRPIRLVTDSYLGWRPAGVLVLAVIVGALFVAGTFSWVFGVLGLLLGASVGSCSLYFPKDQMLAGSTQKAQQDRAGLAAESKQSREYIGRVRQNLTAASSRLQRWRQLLKERQYRESRQYRREQLLKTNWKALRSVPFEDFLEAVFQELGYIVETTKTTGDQGGDLIVSKDGHRTAIQVKGYFSSVSNSAVQEAHTAKDYYRCEACAVVTNSRFTAGAKDVASRVGCILVDEDSLPRLILGQIDLWQLYPLVERQRQSDLPSQDHGPAQPT